MTGLIIRTTLHGGKIAGDDRIDYGFAWHRSFLSPSDVGHDSPVSFSVIQTNGHPEAIHVSLDFQRFNQQPALQKKKRFIPATTR